MAACAMVPPRLLLMGDTPAGRDIAPRLASRLGGAYLPSGTVLAEDGKLQICDLQGRYLDLSIELDVAEDQPPLTVPLVLTLPPGRHRMSWGLHDAELLIVPPDEESAQTIPNLANLDRHRHFTQEAFEPLPVEQRLWQRPRWRRTRGRRVRCSGARKWRSGRGVGIAAVADSHR